MFTIMLFSKQTKLLVYILVIYDYYMFPPITITFMIIWQTWQQVVSSLSDAFYILSHW